MKMPLFLAPVAVCLVTLSAGVVPLRADITVRLSVKFILKPDGTRPDAGDIGTSAGFDAEVTRGNAILAATGRGYRLEVVEYLDIRPPVPIGQPSDFWFNLNAREQRSTIEITALLDQVTWRWNGGAINIFVNNSGSGQCSFVGTGLSISLGNNIATGTVLHEIGHFFDLLHTHAGDYDSNPNTPPFSRADLHDGDLLAETADDNPNITDHDQLSVALFGHIYDPLPPAPPSTPAERAVVDSAYENVMSYHNENTLLPVQMDIWTLHANGARQGFCNGRTWFVAMTGFDGAFGDSAASPFATVAKALSSVSQINDIVLLRTGTYQAPPGRIVTKACTLRSTVGPVTIN